MESIKQHRSWNPPLHTYYIAARPVNQNRIIPWQREHSFSSWQEPSQQGCSSSSSSLRAHSLSLSTRRFSKLYSPLFILVLFLRYMVNLKRLLRASKKDWFYTNQVLKAAVKLFGDCPLLSFTGVDSEI